MGYSMNDGVVKANLFVRRDDGFSGKWKDTVELDMSSHWDDLTATDAVKNAWDAGKSNGVVPGTTGFWLVVIEPYHKYAHPVMVAI